MWGAESGAHFVACWGEGPELGRLRILARLAARAPDANEGINRSFTFAVRAKCLPCSLVHFLILEWLYTYVSYVFFFRCTYSLLRERTACDYTRRIDSGRLGAIVGRERNILKGEVETPSIATATATGKSHGREQQNHHHSVRRRRMRYAQLSHQSRKHMADATRQERAP